MLFGFEQQLDSLPSHKALRCKRRDRRWCERVSFGLQGVEASHRLVYEGQRCRRSFIEEWVVVPAYDAIECCQLGWCQTMNIPWCDLLSLSQAAGQYPSAEEGTVVGAEVILYSLQCQAAIAQTQR